MADVSQTTGLDVATLRKDFPLLAREVNGRPITYLDSASSGQRPVAVLDAMRHYDETTHANVHRGVYSIAVEATRLFEAARHNVGRFIGAPDPTREIVFTKNATEGINLVAHTWGRANLHPGDAIVLTEMEHHANIVPWHMLAEERGLTIRWIPVDDDGRLDLTDLASLVEGAKLVGVTCMSNVLGTINPISDIAEAAHAAGAVVVADGAQSVPHLPTEVAGLGVDFLAFSSHKMLSPTGIGVLWGRGDLLSELPPFLGGGEMIL
jgi:cysteine desulfurase/selenocysteine lyase